MPPKLNAGCVRPFGALFVGSELGVVGVADDIFPSLLKLGKELVPR